MAIQTALMGASLGAGVLGSIFGSKGAKKAAEQQAAAQREIAAMNLQFQREALAKEEENFKRQQDLMAGGRMDLIQQRAGQVLDQTLLDPTQILAEARGFQPTAQLSLQQGAQTLADIFGGQAEAEDLRRLRDITEQRIEAFEPVGEARLEGVASGRQAIEEGFQEALARNDARRAAQGFMGTSTFDRNQMAQNFLRANQQQAQLQAAANLSNAQDIRSMQEQRLGAELAMPEQFRTQRLSLLQEPLSQLQRQTQAITTPEQQVATDFGQIVGNVTGRLPVLTPKGITPLKNTYNPQQQITTGQIVGGGLSALGQGLAGAANQMQMNNLINQMTAQPVSSTPFDPTQGSSFVGGAPSTFTPTIAPASATVVPTTTLPAAGQPSAPTMTPTVPTGGLNMIA